MIKLFCSISHRSPLLQPVDIAIGEIYKKLHAVDSSDALRMVLREMEFDSRYTKPINVNGLLVIRTLITINYEVIITSYTQNYLKWKFFPVNGYVDPENPLIIHLNSRQKRTAKQWEETIWHELIHVSDAFNVASFGHGDNKLTDKEETAPVKLARVMANLTLREGQAV